jgi:hypothetical protein
MVLLFTTSLFALSLVTGINSKGALVYLSNIPSTKLDSSAQSNVGVFSQPLGGGNETLLTDLGPGYGVFWTESVTSSAVHGGGGGEYFATVEKHNGSGKWVPAQCLDPCAAGTTCCSDPRATGKGTGACYKVTSCSQITDGSPTHGVTVRLDLNTGDVSTWNTSKCWKLATTEAIVKANELLCVYEDGGNDTYGGQSHVSRLDLASGKETLVGSFPGDMIVTNNAGALDPTAGKAGVFYAYTTSFADDDPTGTGSGVVYGVDIETGELVAQADGMAFPEIASFGWDGVGGTLVGMAQGGESPLTLGTLAQGPAQSLAELCCEKLLERELVFCIFLPAPCPPNRQEPSQSALRASAPPRRRPASSGHSPR